MFKNRLYIPPVSPILPMYNNTKRDNLGNLDENNTVSDFEFHLLVAKISDLESKYKLNSEDFKKVMDKNVSTQDADYWYSLLSKYDVYIKYNPNLSKLYND